MVAQYSRLHPDTIAEVKQRVDIVDVISEQVALRKCGKDFVGACPFHDEKTPSFSVSPSKQVYHCFGCNAGGDAIKFLMELGSHSFTDVVLDLAQRYGVPVSEFTRSQIDPLPIPQPLKPLKEQAKPEKDYTVEDAYVQRSHERLLFPHGDGADAKRKGQGSIPIDKSRSFNVSPNSPAPFSSGNLREVQQLALSWLEKRGFSFEIIQHYQLGLEEVRVKNSESGNWESYWGIAIFIPVPGRTGRFYKKVRVAPWLTGDNRPKFLLRWSQPGVTTTVFTTYRPEDATSTYFCEGEWDAIVLGWAARIAGAKVAVACSTGGCGTLPPLEQIDALPKPTIIFYDRNDRPNPKTGVRPGEHGAKRLVDSLKGEGFVGEVPMPLGCTVEGWDVSDALTAGYTWSDFSAAAKKALKKCSAIVLYAEPVEHNYDSGEQWSFWEWAWDEWQKYQQGGGNGGGTGKNHGNRRPSRKEVKDFCQIAISDIFSDAPWIFVRNAFWRWTDTHYSSVAIEVVVKKIAQYCDSYAVPTIDKNTGETVWWYKYANPRSVDAVLRWAKDHLCIDPALVNPPGLNCVDGVLQLSYDPDSQKWIRTLVPHDPRYYYLYPPQATYNIPAVVKPDACDTLLSCLDEQQRDIFLKTIAAALDLNTVRIYKGREIRALLNLGLGSNGKDTLREVTAMMFGNRGMAGASLTDFKQYDEGRKFPLLQLDGALINWPSENADCMLIDKLQSLKIAITGDPLSAEKKGKDEYKFNCRCIHLFNVNNTPKLLGAIEAITSRFSILRYTKTYKTNPGPGELKADPRFLYDKTFVRTEVLPWYLHRVLDALDRLMSEGINYSCTEAAFENVREESDHIYAFCKEVGIGYLPNAQITATQAWEKLREWYIANGTLEIKDLGDGKTKDIWNSQTTWGDHTIKGSNQILPRLLKIFPKATRARDSFGRNCLEGIGFLPPNNDSGGGGSGDSGGGSPPNLPNSPSGNSVSLSNNSEAGLNVFEAGLNQSNPSRSKDDEATEANLAISRVKNLWTVLTEEERTQFLQELGLEKNSGANSSNQVQPVQNSDRVSDTVSSVNVQPPSVQVQNLPEAPTTQDLANQILLCQSWVAAAHLCNRSGAILQAAVEEMSLEQQSRVPELMVAHLLGVESELLATELKTMWGWVSWLTTTLQEQVWSGLRFTVMSMGEFSLHEDPIVIRTQKCRLLALSERALGKSRTLTEWVFQTPDGSNIKAGEGWFELEH